MALHLDVEPGDVIRIGASSLRMERKSGQRARLRIDSSEDVELIKAGSAPRAEPEATAPPPAANPESGPAPVLKRPGLAALAK